VILTTNITLNIIVLFLLFIHVLVVCIVRCVLPMLINVTTTVAAADVKTTF